MAYAAATQIGVGDIPVIDISALRSERSDAAAGVGAQMRAAAEGIGFFYVRGHGIAPHLIDEVFRTARALFTASPAQKQSVAVNPFHRGFLQVGAAKMSGNTKSDLKESFVSGWPRPRPARMAPPNTWPEFLPALRPALNAWFAAGNVGRLGAAAGVRGRARPGAGQFRAQHRPPDQPRLDRLLSAAAARNGG